MSAFSMQAFRHYQAFIFSSVAHELKIRFSRSRLGFFWMVLQPLLQVLIYALVLSNVLAAKLPNVTHPHAYVCYLMSGTLAWSLMQEIVMRFLTLFIDQANLIKKISFPRWILVASAAVVALLNQVILLLATLSILLMLGVPISWSTLLMMPVLMVMLTTFAVGLGLIGGVLNVFVRDLAYVVPIILQVLFWATPIVYPVSILPEAFQTVLKYNPLWPFIQAYQAVIVYANLPSMFLLMKGMGISILVFSLGWLVFSRAHEEMADVL